MATRQDKYRDAGVNIDLADNLIDRIKPLVASTRRKGMLGDIGGFGGLFSPKLAGFEDPVLVSGTDGVGTKLKIAQAMNKHDTVGVDLVAMCVNDIITSGAEPLFFLDYFAIGKLDVKVGYALIKGITDGCRQAGCALIGGETAEMPGFYPPGEYDLAGFAVGAIERKNIIDGSKTRPGDLLIGIASSGLHSNGYSLVRKVFLDDKKYSLKSKIKGVRGTLGAELIKPTKIYVKSVLEIARKFPVKGIAHITGGGITENLPRVLPKNSSAVIYRKAWKPASGIFDILQNEGGVDDAGMYRTFNMGIGMILVVSAKHTEAVLESLIAMKEQAYLIGCIVKDAKGPRVYYDPPLK